MRSTRKPITWSLVVAVGVAAACVSPPPDGDVDVLRRPVQAQGELVSKLAAALESSNPVARMRAAVALLDLGPAAQPAVDALLRVAQTSDQGTKMAAITALGAVGDPRAADFLGSLISDESGLPMDRAAAARALGVMQDRNRIPQLQLALGSRDRLVRAQAMEAIVSLDGDLARDIAAEMIGSSDPLVRVHAASLLAATDPQAKDILVEGAAQGEDPTLRSTALAVMARRVASNQLPADGLVEGVSSDLSADQQIAVYFLQASQGDGAAADALEEMSASGDPAAMQAAVALGNLFATPAGASAREKFIGLAAGGAGELSVIQVGTALAAINIGFDLVASGDAAVFEVLVPRFDATLKGSKDVGTRTLAARTLGFIGSDEAKAALESSLGAEKDLGVQLTIETALYR